MGGNREYRPRLSEVMSTGEPSSEGQGADSTQLAFGVPPPREVHLTKPRDDEPQLQETVQVNFCKRDKHLPLPTLALRLHYLKA
jgi:hypothetical protein